MIDQISFGNSKPRIDSCLGLHLGLDAIYLSEVTLSGGLPKVTHLLRLPLSSSGARDTKTGGSLNTDFLADKERIGGLLSKAMSGIRWKSKYVVVTLSHHFGILRYFTLPAIDRRFWKTAVPTEAKKFIPIPFASLVHDFQMVPLSSDGNKRPRYGVLFGVTDRKNLSNIEELVRAAGFTLMGVELAPCSTERLWDALQQAPGAVSAYAQVHFDGGEVRILISEGGVPIFFREVFLGEGATAMDRRKIDLAGCVDFTKKQLGSGGPTTLRLSGQVADMEAWRQAFSQDLGQTATVLNINKALGLREAQWGGYSAIGAALRYLISTPLQLDLGSIGRVADEERRAARTILAVTGVLSGLLLALGGLRYASLHYKSGQLAQARRKGAVLEAFRGRNASDIEKLISDMQDKVNAFSSITLKQVPLTRLLASIAEVIPEPVWVDNINYSNPLSLGTVYRPNRTLRISGHTLGPSRSVEQDLAFRFTESLTKHPLFKQAFASIEQSVSAPAGFGDDSAPAPGTENSEGMHTSYAIQCQSAKKGS